MGHARHRRLRHIGIERELVVSAPLFPTVIGSGTWISSFSVSPPQFGQGPTVESFSE